MVQLDSENQAPWLGERNERRERVHQPCVSGSARGDEGQFLCLFYKKAIIAVSLFLVAGQVLAADGWKGDGTGKIESVQPEVYRVGAEGGYATFVETSNIASADCGGTTWVIKSGLDEDKRLYSAVLAAFAAGYGVKLYQWSCYSIGGSFYPRIGGIKVIK